MFIDAHCHLERHTFGDQLGGVIERAFAAQLSHMVAVGASRVAEGASEAIALAERYPTIYATAGIHPHDAGKATPDQAKRTKAYEAAQRIIHDQALWVPLGYPTAAVLTSAKVSGYRVSPFGRQNFGTVAVQ